MAEAGYETNVQLARAIDVDPSTVSDWLNRGAWPRAGKIDRLARALGVPREVVEWYAGFDVQETVSAGAPLAVQRLDPQQLAALVAQRLRPVGELPIAEASVSAGAGEWRSPGDHAMLERLSAGDLWATVVSGDCLEPEVRSGDIVLVDRSDLLPRPGSIVIVLTEDGEVLVKRVEQRNGEVVLADHRGAVYRPVNAVLAGRVVFVGRRV